MRSADGSVAEDCYRRGTEVLQQGNVEEAVAWLRRALDDDPSHANALYRLGTIEERRGDRASAVDLYQRALQAHPGHVSAGERLRVVAGPRDPQPALAVRPSGHGLVGTVAARQRLAEWDSTRRQRQLLLLRITRREPGGQAGAVFAAEMRGPSIRGGIEVGDWVELPPRWRPGRPLLSLANLTTGEHVEVVRPAAVARAFTLLAVAFVVVWIVAIFSIVAIHLFGPGAPDAAYHLGLIAEPR
jgi:tetratricopeptide repeat protein